MQCFSRTGLLTRVLFVALLAARATEAQKPVEAPPREEPWDFSANVFYSDPPGSKSRFTPIVYADRGPLHLELRYNYEDLQTTSFFGGWTFESAGKLVGELETSFTPMLGAVMGDTDALAPGLEFDLGWRRLRWYAETEYLLDRHDRDDDYFYSWSTLTYAFSDELSAGLVSERTRLVDGDDSLQRGLALELTLGGVGFALYTYDIGTDDAYTVLALELVP
jgi:hypothetical protein